MAVPQNRLSRVQIPGPMGPPRNMDPNAPMFTPMQQGGVPPNFAYSLNTPGPLQTPMQTSFFAAQHPPPPQNNRRPPFGGHGHRLSLAPMPPPGVGGFPPGLATPVQGQFPPQMMLNGQAAFGQPFQGRNRRAPSISTGGPPKAVLGGPGRNHSPMPVTAAAAAAQQVKKKIVVNLPKETIDAGSESGESPRANFARTPLPLSGLEEMQADYPKDITTAEIYPADKWRLQVPDSVDVFLPGKSQWDEIKRAEIDEKLQQLGIDKASGSNVPHIHAPHARAASISSPADPALLMFKLNKLHASQQNESSSSTSSPQPLHQTPSPNPMPPRFQGMRHGHSLSLAHVSSYSQQPSYNPTAAFNPFGPNAVLGSDQIQIAKPPLHEVGEGGGIFAGSTLAPPVLSRPSSRESRPDFLRGFGLDVHEEVEEGVEELEDALRPPAALTTESVEEHNKIEEDAALQDSGYQERLQQQQQEDEDPDAIMSASHSRHHSRHISHVSRVSVALSLRSLGGKSDPGVSTQERLDDDLPQHTYAESAVEEVDNDMGDWTGSSDEESIGEWSNPSDEERARQERFERRLRRRAQRQRAEVPRKLPPFPQPPVNAALDMKALRGPDEDDEEYSNPSDEGYGPGPADEREYFPPPSAVRPLPPVPLPNIDSMYNLGQRRGSDVFYPLAPRPVARTPVPQAFDGAPPRKESLNPLAEPFVFGAPPSGSWTVASHQGQSSQGSAFGHSRRPSLGRPLNASAAEFVPTTFTFRPPEPAPHIKFPEPAPRPLPQIPYPAPTPNSGRAVQGREKRRRHDDSRGEWESDDAEGERDTDADNEGEDIDFDGDGHVSLESFKFPMPSAQQRRSAPASPSHRTVGLNVNAKPFTFSGFSTFAASTSGATFPEPQIDAPPAADAASTVGEEEDAPRMLMPVPNLDSDSIMDDSIDAALYGDSASPTAQLSMSLLQPNKPKRAPIPLDFKNPHPISNNTVPAGLFKALTNGDDERTRATVRSRLSSREYLEHTSRPSLDDAAVLSISKQKPTTIRRVTSKSPMSRSPNVWASEPLDLFNPLTNTNQTERRPSMPASHASDDDSILSMDVAGKRASDDMLKRFEAHLEERLDQIQRGIDLSESSRRSAAMTTEAMVSEVLSLFRTQIHQSAVQSIEESTAQARADMDFEIIKDIIQESQTDGEEKLVTALNNAVDHVRASIQVQLQNMPGLNLNMVPFLEDISNNITNTILGMATNLAARMDNLNVARPSSATERDLLLRELMASLTPLLTSLRPEPIDYDGLTHRLTQAVKPHISQLIDLASDKRETAQLIVNSLAPMLPDRSSSPSAFDTEAIVSQLKADIHSIVAPLDAHVIKEQVADLVVERIDSRLAVRDRTFSPDIMAARVSESVSLLLEPVQQILAAIGNLSQSQQHLVSQNLELTNAHQNAMEALDTLSAGVTSATEAMTTAHTASSSNEQIATSAELAGLGVSVEHLTSGQEQVLAQVNEIAKMHQDVLERVKELPEAVDNAARVLQSVHADILKRAPTKQETDELRKLATTNSDLQMQVVKARSTHGQLRVEKDHLSERLQSVEAERERLRGLVEIAQQGETAKASEASALEARNAELEEALAQALARLKTSDVTAQTNQERIAELEKANRELSQEKQSFKSKVDALEIQAKFAARDKEVAEKVLALVQTDRDHLASQQSHWDDLRRTAEQLETLSNLIGKMDDEEVRELQRIRDRSKVLEGEHTALQKRFKEQDSKLANAEKASSTARQNLAQVKERAAEWERRGRDLESDLESARSKLDQVEETNAQLDADYSLAKLQLEERATEERATKDRESKLKDQVANLDGRITKLQAELDETKRKAEAELAATKQPSRPDSRASTVYVDSPDRATTPTTPVMNGARPKADNSGVWSSQHNPLNRTAAPYSTPQSTAPKPRYPPAYNNSTTSYNRKAYSNSSYYRRAPSPTPSVVTQGEDGWWS